MQQIAHHPEAGDIARALWPIAKEVPVKPAHWITTPDGSSYYTDHGAEFCRDCGRAMVRHLRKKDRKNRREYILDGGWVSEHETPPHCAGCGSKLEASLLAYGAIEELNHFRENPPNPRSASQVYEVHEMLVALEYTDGRNSWAAHEAIAIGRYLVAAITPDKGA